MKQTTMISIIKYLFIFFQVLFTDNRQINFIYFSSEIHLVISGNGNQNIFSDLFNFEPDEVIVNKIPKASCKKSCIFDSEINNVTIYFNDYITSCKNMFYNLSNIIEIDLSNFDFSRVTTMEKMFMICADLKKVNLGNMNTSLVTSLNSLFDYCDILESIDIINFNTSSVTTMRHMFFHCHSLKSIVFPETFDTSNVVDMDAMFSNCKALKTLNLSLFNTRKVKKFCFMFNCCVNLTYLDIPNFSSNIINDMSLTFHRLSSLIYLNINNLEINTNTLMNQAFDEASPFLKVCANQPNMKNNLSSYSDIINNCSDICFIKDIKLDINLNKCIKSCKHNGYTYEYNNICYN